MLQRRFKHIQIQGLLRQNLTGTASRSAWLLLWVFTLLLLISVFPGTALSQRTSSRPNIILILTDDQRWDTLEYMPHVQERMIDRGFLFTNAFATIAQCCPARASFLTGQYTFHHEVWHNSGALGGADLFDPSSTIATWLNARGYTTALLGKYLNQYNSTILGTPPGWDHWFAFDLGNEFEDRDNYTSTLYSLNGELVHYSLNEQSDAYSTDLLAAESVKFITANQDRPFFLFLNPFAPHSDYIPAARHAGAFANIEPHRPPNFNERFVTDKSWLQRTASELSENRIATVDQIRIRQLETLLAVDEAVATIFDTLDALELSEKTIVIFTSDHGYAWGEHRLLLKPCPYDECLRIPFAVFDPFAGQTPQVIDQTILNLDVAPTIAQMADVPYPERTIDGQSILPILRDACTDCGHETFVFEYYGAPDGNGNTQQPPFLGLRTQKFHYIRFATGEEELYNIEDDPFQLTNLATEQSGRIKNMSEELHELTALNMQTAQFPVRVVPNRRSRENENIEHGVDLCSISSGFFRIIIEREQLPADLFKTLEIHLFDLIHENAETDRTFRQFILNEITTNVQDVGRPVDIRGKPFVTGLPSNVNLMLDELDNERLELQVDLRILLPEEAKTVSDPDEDDDADLDELPDATQDPTIEQACVVPLNEEPILEMFYLAQD